MCENQATAYEQKRVAVLQDLSGMGRCALTVAIPVLAVLGVQPCPIPTAVLSAHTAYEGSAVCDLTDFMENALNHWDWAQIPFHAVLSGYLATVRQAELIHTFAERQRAKNGTFIAIDPAMADGGKLYRGLPAQMPDAMRALCRQADLIMPNATEAALLTQTPCADGTVWERDAQDLLEKLLMLGCKSVVIKGVKREDGRMANVCMRAGEKEYHSIAYQPLSAAYPGTGDLFAAFLVGALLMGDHLSGAMSRATDFVYRAIERTMQNRTPPREGVQFEPLLREIWAL